MPTAKIAISIDPDDLREVDALVRRGISASRSKLIQDAVREKLDRVKRVRLAEECARLVPELERAEAEQWLNGETPWPEY
jgi:Arc/MetJ-type ribon-helix-helix transcriptional regulator